MIKKTIVVGVTSGIAAYKAVELVKLLKIEGFDVFVIMTHHATKMVPVSEFEHASGHKVFVDLFEDGFDYKTVLETRQVDHIELADKADLLVIVPATANTVAKIAHGMADDFLTTTTLAVTAPVLVCPSMNVNMWHNPAVQKNVACLKNLGYQIIEPAEGMLACGYEGKGRLEDVNVIKAEIVRQLEKTDSLKGKKIIITAGGTTEKLDDVRSITNKSSGKMGIAIAEACYLRGADVLLVRAKDSVKARYLLPEKVFVSADDLQTIMEDTVQHYDVLFHTAAVSDFQLAEPITGKISSNSNVHLHLKPRTKILDQLKKLNPSLTLIAFKAEYGLSEAQLIEVAHQRLIKSQADAIVANDVSQSDRGFQADTNEVIIILKDATHHKIGLASKREVAAQVIEFLSQELAKN
jgi:phosphopantothenoylcysteine decarboxylase/phosphopantothenate--cysteine ligase